MNGDTPMVKFLQLAGADIFEKSNSGWSVLHCAALSGKFSLLQQLFQQAKVSISEATNDGFAQNSGRRPYGACITAEGHGHARRCSAYFRGQGISSASRNH
jgi:hypothetical protein